MTADIAKQKRQYRSLIEERTRKPRYCGTIASSDLSAQCQNPTCGDRITLTIKLSNVANTIQEIKHDSCGCAISTVSADLMSEAVAGKTVDEAISISQHFSAMLAANVPMPESLDKLNALSGVARFPIKIKCAALCWRALDAALNESRQKSQSESRFGHLSSPKRLQPSLGLSHR